ncbi:MAG: LacI family DNA-binding transcriptional regulator [Rhodoglobus sp.]
MPRRPTVYDVAARAGVSIATVSFAFRQPDRVRTSTREAVLMAARELGYAPSANARGLAEGNTGAFGLYSFDLMLAEADTVSEQTLLSTHDDTVDPRIFPLYVDEVERGFALECRARGRALLLASGAPSGSDIFDVAGRVDGLAVFPGPHRPDALHNIAQSIPVVSFSTPADAGPFSHIHVDNRLGLRQLVQHVFEVHGVTDVAFVGDTVSPEYEERFLGFREACETFALHSPSDGGDRDALATEHWEEALTRLIAADAVPKALFCHTDQVAFEVLDLLASLDVSVPGDAIVTGFDGILAGRLSKPTLTTSRQPLESMGRLAVSLLSKRVKDHDVPLERHIMPPRPIYRQSCGCAGA